MPLARVSRVVATATARARRTFTRASRIATRVTAASRMDVIAFPALRDNFALAIRCAETNAVALVDAPDVDDIARGLAMRAPEWAAPSVVLCTHWHADHVGACDGLRARYGTKTYAPEREREKIGGAMDVGVGEGSEVMIGRLRAVVRETPGHTLGHVVYHFPEHGHVFVGDTMFALGCGRLFEGTPGMMWSSISKILDMPDETKVWFAHEYTLANAKFALSVDPTNEALRARAADIEAKRARGEATVPTTVGEERRTNPFCRPDSEGVQRGVNMLGHGDLAAVFGAVRAAKDRF